MKSPTEIIAQLFEGRDPDHIRGVAVLAALAALEVHGWRLVRYLDATENEDLTNGY
jgi:hypothetical protein